ncbi:hypothetical protein HQ590_07240, partial [bacterium]|nr:hypothetical protein [bacterium]
MGFVNRFRSIVGILVVTLATAAHGQTAGGPGPTAESHYLAGLDKQNQGDLSASQADARQLYTEAIAEYQAAVQRQPDHYRANLYWAVCLAQLAVLDPDPDAARQYLLGANQQFARAADCPGADHAVFEQWANLLLGNMLSLVEDPADQIVLLREAARVCERGLAIAQEPGPRAQLVQHLGRALRQWADLTADPAERQELLLKAEDHLRAAGAAIAAHQRWQTGLANQDAADLAATPDDARRLYRAAIADYQTAAAAEPDHYESHLFWATCLTQLFSLTDDHAERQHLLREADQRFAIASGCPRPNHVVFDQWTSLLLGNLDTFAPDPTQRVVRVQQAVSLAKRGLALATAPTPQAQLQLRLGDALCQLAAASASPQDQRALLDRAVDHLRAATAVVTVRQALYRNGYLGVALLSLGRLIEDPARLREAAAEFEATLQ